MLKHKTPQHWIFEEINDLGKIEFNFKDKEEAIHYVSDLSLNMNLYEMPDLLSAGFYCTQFNPESIQALYDYLTPEKMKVMVISKKFEEKTNLIEKWYKTEYKLEKISEEELLMLQQCGQNENFDLPCRNSFIPKNLALIEHQEDLVSNLPRIISIRSHGRLWYKEDTKHRLPKASIRFEIRNQLASVDPIHSNMLNVFVSLFDDFLNEYAYDAYLASLTYSISSTKYGLDISFSGFNDKMNILLEKVFQKLVSFKINSSRFEIIKEMVSEIRSFFLFIWTT